MTNGSFLSPHRPVSLSPCLRISPSPTPRWLSTYPIITYAVTMPNQNPVFHWLAIRNQVRPSGRLWNPAADVYHSEDGWVVKIDLAGVTADDLEIVISDSHLTVRGCRRDTFYREGYTYQQMEITYSRFEKSIQFPCSIQGASLQRDYRDGLLIIVLRCDNGCSE